MILPSMFVSGLTCGNNISMANKAPAKPETKSLGLDDLDFIMDFVIRNMTKFSIVFTSMYWSMYTVILPSLITIIHIQTTEKCQKKIPKKISVSFIYIILFTVFKNGLINIIITRIIINCIAHIGSLDISIALKAVLYVAESTYVFKSMLVANCIILHIIRKGIYNFWFVL